MKYYNLVYCKHHPEDNRAYLYSLPSDADVNCGDRLYVRDRRGEHIVSASSPNFYASEEFAEMLCTNNGGYFPPAKVVGTVNTITVTQDVVNTFEEEIPF